MWTVANSYEGELKTLAYLRLKLVNQRNQLHQYRVPRRWWEDGIDFTAEYLRELQKINEKISIVDNYRKEVIAMPTDKR